MLEQLIIKRNAQVGIAGMEPKKDGIDFKFSSKSRANKFVEFLKSVDTSKLQSGQMLQRNDTCIQQHQGRSKRERKRLKRNSYEI